MDEQRDDNRPGELIYPPPHSWLPPLIAAGIAGVVASIFTWWPYGAVGALVALPCLWLWIRGAREDFGRLPRRQETVSAVLPAIPLRRRGE